jgi:dolichol-phosphate mannosyltransferase
MYNGISVIVSDDGSNDGTKKIVNGLRKRNRNILLLDRSQRKVHGLTASVLDAVMITGTKKVVVMDGDMQHPPSKLGNIADALDRYDLVIGIRTRVKKWELYRMVQSKGIAYLSYVLFALVGRRKCNDMMSGFFGIDTNIFKDLIKRHRKEFVEEGYKVLLDILKVMGRSGTIGEVRYSTFHLRKAGKSKFEFKHVMTTLRSLR